MDTKEGGSSMDHFRRIVTILAITVLLACPLSAATAAADPGMDKNFFKSGKTDPAAMLVDLVTARPLGAVSIAVGTATYIVSLPFSLLGGNAGAAFNRLVADPFSYTFFRRLGDI